MTFEEALAKIKKGYAKVDASAVTEHVAVQLNIQGEGEGALYVEVADGKVNVEGYEYYDKDATLYATAEEFVKIATFKAELAKEVAEDKVSVSGNYDKAMLLNNIKKAAAKKATKKAVEAPVVEEAPAKKAPCKRTKKVAKVEAEAVVAEAPVAEEAPAKKTTKRASKKKVTE